MLIVFTCCFRVIEIKSCSFFDNNDCTWKNNRYINTCVSKYSNTFEGSVRPFLDLFPYNAISAANYSFIMHNGRPSQCRFYKASFCENINYVREIKWRLIKTVLVVINFVSIKHKFYYRKLGKDKNKGGLGHLCSYSPQHQLLANALPLQTFSSDNRIMASCKF